MIIGLMVALSVALAQPKTIVLTDGSELVGNVIVINAEGCKIETKHLGLVTISHKDIKDIIPIEATKRPPATRSKVEREMMALQLHRETQQRAFADQQALIMNLMMADPAMANTIKRLQDKPELLEAISNPSILLALEMGDIETLMNTPAIRDLLDEDTIKALKRIEMKNSD